MTTFSRIALALGLAGTADLLSKRAVLGSLAPGQRHEVFSHLVAFVCVHNARGAMGLFGDRPALLVSLSLVVLTVLGFLLQKSLQRSALTQIGFGLVAGGALGNVVDRAIHGYVVDFVALPGFWIFNTGDACITAGLILIAWPALRGQEPSAA